MSTVINVATIKLCKRKSDAGCTLNHWIHTELGHQVYLCLNNIGCEDSKSMLIVDADEA